MKEKELKIEVIWDWLTYYELFTENELRLITDMNGYNIKTINDAIYARYGYRDYKDLLNEWSEKD